MNKLEGINVGDKVIVYLSYSKNIRTVKRLTKTLVVLDNGSRYKKEDGYLYGARGFYVPHIEKATPKLIDEVNEENKRRNFISKLSTYPWNRLTTDKLEKVYELINK